MDIEENKSIESSVLEDKLEDCEDSEESLSQKDPVINQECIQGSGPAPKALNMSPGAVKLRNWLNKCLRIEMSDGRVLIGVFLCTDRDANVILGSCREYLPDENKESTSSFVNDEPRMLGLVMVPGKHIVTISIDETIYPPAHSALTEPLKKELNSEEVM